MTGRDLVTASLRLIGAIAPGESIEASEATDGLAAFNRMLDSWSLESLVIQKVTEAEIPLSIGVQDYSIGPSGDLIVDRPVKIEYAKLKLSTNTPPTYYPVRILSVSEWASIRQKSLQSTIPDCVFIEGTFPNETLRLFPVPNASSSLVLYYQSPLSSISTLDTQIVLPPGYERALVYNFAIEIASEYGKIPTEIVFKIATDSKASIKRNNHRPSFLRVDDALVSNNRYNIYTDGAR